MNNSTDQIVDFQGAGQAGSDTLLFTGFGSGTKFTVAGSLGSSTIYDITGATGGVLGRVLIASGGAVLQNGDYVFA